MNGISTITRIQSFSKSIREVSSSSKGAFKKFKGTPVFLETNINSSSEGATIFIQHPGSILSNDFNDGLFSFKKSRFILQILNRISTYYLIYLRQIDKKSVMIEKRLHKSMKNRELIQLHSLEKSLV